MHARSARSAAAFARSAPVLRRKARFPLVVGRQLLSRCFWLDFDRKRRLKSKKRNTRLRLRSPSNIGLSYRILPNFSSLFYRFFRYFHAMFGYLFPFHAIFSHNNTYYIHFVSHALYASAVFLHFSAHVILENVYSENKYHFPLFFERRKNEKTAAALELSNAATVYISRYYYFAVSSLTFSRTHSRWQSGVSEGTVQSAPTTMPTLPVSSKRPSVNF